MTQDKKAGGIVKKQEAPGQFLRSVRQQKGLDAETVRDQIGLTGTLFDALENDDYHRLPSAVYVKGYLRRYAELMGVRPAAVLANYQNFLEVHGFVEPAQSEEPLVGDKPYKAMGLASLFLLLTTSLVFGAILTDSEDGQVEEQFQQIRSVESSQTEVADEKAPLENQLHLEFVTDSWVEVVDSRDYILTVSLQRAGSNLVLEGIPPFDINLGYGPGVNLSYMEKPVELEYDPETFAVDMTLGQ